MQFLMLQGLSTIKLVLLLLHNFAVTHDPKVEKSYSSATVLVSQNPYALSAAVLEADGWLQWGTMRDYKFKMWVT